MSELKPCPFCGGEAVIKEQEVQYGLCGAWVYCTKCSAKTNYMNTHEMFLRQGSISTPLTPESRERGIKKAIDAWNRRVGCEAAAEYAKGNRPKDGTWPGEEGEKG